MPKLPTKYQVLSAKISIFYLNQIEKIENKSLGVQIVDFISSPVQKAKEQVKSLITKAAELEQPGAEQAMVELIETILVYKFDKLNRREIEDMFNLSELKQTRFYQEAREDGEQIGIKIGEQIIQ